MVVAGPGDRRDEDIRDIARAVAGKFDHYICRRDDGLRGRAPDEVPQMIAAVLLESGVPTSAITLIPDEQEAIDAALRMGQPGDLLLIFADALTRSWKQVTKFKPDNSVAKAQVATRPAATQRAEEEPEHAADQQAAHQPAPAAGFVRDERGLRFVGEAGD